jgi:signal transduction histidine kinase
MSVAVAALGWVVAAGALAVALAARRELDARMERLARAAHELRRPLTAARLAAHGLAGANGDRPARAAALERELARAGRLVSDLDAVRGVAAPVWPGESRPVVVAELVAEVAEEWRELAAGWGRRLVVDPLDAAGAVVRGDDGRLAQALGNLVANALEHGAGTVRLGANLRARGVAVHVTDDGSGLPGSLDELVGRARAGRGARGRGLAIAAEIARAHGGALRVERTRRGLRMALDLPCTAMAPAAS